MFYAGFGHMVPRGLEPRTLRLLAVRSNQLSYETLSSHPPSIVRQFYCDANAGSLHMLVTRNHWRAPEATGVQRRQRETTGDHARRRPTMGNHHALTCTGLTSYAHSSRSSAVLNEPCNVTTAQRY